MLGGMTVIVLQQLGLWPHVCSSPQWPSSMGRWLGPGRGRSLTFAFPSNTGVGVALVGTCPLPHTQALSSVSVSPCPPLSSSVPPPVALRVQASFLTTRLVENHDKNGALFPLLYPQAARQHPELSLRSPEPPGIPLAIGGPAGWLWGSAPTPCLWPMTPQGAEWPYDMLER